MNHFSSNTYSLKRLVYIGDSDTAFAVDRGYHDNMMFLKMDEENGIMSSASNN